MTQLFIAIFGLTAIILALSQNATHRKLAPIWGLIGQPFWFLATVPTEQWGMVALSIAYTLVYAHAAWVHWRPA